MILAEGPCSPGVLRSRLALPERAFASLLATLGSRVRIAGSTRNRVVSLVEMVQNEPSFHDNSSRELAQENPGLESFHDNSGREKADSRRESLARGLDEENDGCCSCFEIKDLNNNDNNEALPLIPVANRPIPDANLSGKDVKSSSVDTKFPSGIVRVEHVVSLSPETIEALTLLRGATPSVPTGGGKPTPSVPAGVRAELDRLRPFMIARARISGEIKKSEASWWRGVEANLIADEGARMAELSALADHERSESAKSKAIRRAAAGKQASEAMDAKAAGMTVEEYRRRVGGGD